VSTTSPSTLEDVRVGVRPKISALWIAMLILFAYGDIFGFFKPGQIEEVMSGEIGEDAYYLFLSAVEIAMLLLTVGYAWTWSRRSS
jgi:hypothetical protein